MKGKVPLQGAKHLLWDYLVMDITKSKQYLNYVDDKSVVASTTLQKCTVVNETLLRRPLETTQNAINFLNTISNAHLQILGIKSITVVIVWARKILGKHNHVRNVQSKAKQIQQNVKYFKDLLTQLFQKGLPSFGDDNGRLIPHEKYHVLLTQAQMDHSKFDGLKKEPDANVVIEKITDDFEILSQFRALKAELPPIYYASRIELEVIIKEMMDCLIPSQN